ncbi:MAG: tetratricopeptide repeat protein [Myxococcota bacterium]
MTPAPSPRSTREDDPSPAKPPPGERRLAPWLALVFCVACLAYANSLPNGFTLDDKTIVEHNEKIRSLDQIPAIWSSSYWPRHRYIKAYRPLTVTTYALNHAVHGLRPFGYHLVNVLLHAGVSALVLLLALRLGVPLAGGLLAGLFFAVHPIHTDVVSGVVGRAEILAALAFVGGLFLWLRYRESGRWRDLAALVAVYALGNLAKEQVIVLPGILFVAEFAFHRFGDPAGRRRLAAALAGCAVVLAGIFILRAGATGSVLAGNLTAHPATTGLLYGEPLRVRAMTFLKVLQEIARLFLFPITLSPDYTFNQISIPRHPDRSVIAGACVALLSLLWFLRARRAPRRLLMGLWAFLIYLPVSNLLVPLPLLFAERILYVPSIGLAIILGDWLVSGKGWRDRRARVALVAMAGVIIVLWGARTVARNPDWRNQLTLFEAGVKSAPDSAFLHMSYGIELLNRDRAAEAARELEHAVRIHPELAVAHYKLSIAYQKLGEPVEAERAIRNLLHFKPDRPTPWVQLGRVLVMQGRPGDAARALRRGLALNPGNRAITELLEEIALQRRQRSAAPP